MQVFAWIHKWMGNHRLTVFLGMAILLSTVAGNSQISGTGSIQGTVQDATGAVIPNASVTITETSTQVQHTSTSSGSGLYSFPNIPIGKYTVDVTAPGFEAYRQTNVVLEVGSSIAVNVNMTVGRADQRIEVQAEGLALQTEDSSFKQTIDEKNIVELPLNGRQMTALITLSGASAPAPGNDMVGSKNFFSSVSISIAGGMGNATNYRLDGGDNNDYMTNVNLPFPFPDAVNQFSVESTALGAQDGLHTGGLVNVVTRSGTNAWHGSAFEFIRNNYIDATNFFANKPDTLHQNFYGGTLGGKIIKDKLFFFVGYQRQKADQSSSSKQAYVPTPANLQGDFSVTDGASCQAKGAVQLVNPQTGAILTNNQINPATFSPASVALAKYLPPTTDPCGLVFYSIPSLITENQFISRVDATLSQKHSLYARYFLDGYQQPAYFSPTNILITTSAGNYERVQSLTIGEVYTINSNTVNSFHATGARRRDNRGPAPGINANTVGINISAPYTTGLQVSVTNKFSLYCGTCAPGFFNDNTFAFSDDVNLVRGKHQIVFGGEYVRNQLNISNAYESNGNFSFSGIYSQHGPTGTGGAGTGTDANLDFLTGSMSGFGQSPSQQNALRAPIPSLYAQDTFHATKRLVMTAGLRWEPEFWPVDVFGRGSIFDMNAFLNNQVSSVYPTAPAGSFFYGDKGVPKAFTKNSPWQFSPNLGVTFDPFGTGKTVFRGGAEMAYDEPNFFTGQRVNQNPPFATAIGNTPVGVPLSFAAPYSSGSITTDPFPQPHHPTATSAVFPNGGQFIVLPKQFHPPYTIQWTASVQQEFGRGWQFEVDYIGNKTSFAALGLPIDPATYIPGTWSGPGSCGALTVSPGVGKPCSSVGNQAARYALTLANPTQGAKYLGGGGGSVLVSSGANANYNAMVTSIQHRLSSNFSFLANYTFSKCIDVEDAQGDIATTTVENPKNINLDRAACGFDYRHMINSTLVATSHFGLTGWKALAFNNWEIAPLMQIRSGGPINVVAGQDFSLTSIGNDRPNLVDPYHVYTGRKITQSAANGGRQYLSRAAFAQIPASQYGGYGNLGRNAFRGFSYYDVDSEISRLFPIKERFTLDLRLEAFNVLNHPNLGSPTGNLSSATFGQVSSSAAARIFQGAAKITF